MKKATHALGIAAALLAMVLWRLGRWLHEVRRCLRGASAGGRPLADCVARVEWPAPLFALWVPLMVLSALWGVYLLATGKRWLGTATLCAALGVFILTTSFM